jgi:hypothetical protein
MQAMVWAAVCVTTSLTVVVAVCVTVAVAPPSWLVGMAVLNNAAQQGAHRQADH